MFHVEFIVVMVTASLNVPRVSAPAVSFSQHSAMRYTLRRTKDTVTDKLSMTIKPDTLNARLDLMI